MPEQLHPLFKAKVINGQLVFDQNVQELRADYIKSLEEKDVIESIKIKRAVRSNQQNRYLWGVVYKIIADHLGYSPTEVHELLKGMLGLKEDITYINKNSKTITLGILVSTTEYDTLQLENYAKKCREWASIELGCYIPLPNEVEIPEYYQ